jgi:hypothetical protein
LFVLFVIDSLGVDGLLFVIDSITVADPLFVIEDSRDEERGRRSTKEEERNETN